MALHDNLKQTFKNYKAAYIDPMSSEIDSEFTSLSTSQSEIDSTQNTSLASLSTAASELSEDYDSLHSEVADKQDKLTPGAGINIDANGIISAEAIGSGHEIINSAGTTLTQRDELKFDAPFTATDDSTNEQTKIGLQKMVSTEMDDIVTPLPSHQVVVNNINDMGDVNISSPADGQVLEYNSSTGKWENANGGGGGGGSSVTLGGNQVNVSMTLTGDVLTITTSSV